MKKIIVLILLLMWSLVFIGCGKDEQKVDVKDGNGKKSNETETIEKEVKIEITIPIQKISQLTIENAVQVFLSLQEHQIKWMVELNKIAKERGMDQTQIAEGEQEGGSKIIAIKEQKEREFFEKWGLTKEKFEKFFQENGDTVQAYIAKNESIQQFLERLQQKTQELYMTGEGLSEDEGYDEDQ